MNTNIPTVHLFHDTRRAKKGDTYPVKITIYFGGEKKRYSTKINVTKEQWKKIKGDRLKDSNLKNIKKKLDNELAKAESITENLKSFSFDKFSKEYHSTLALVDKKSDLVGIYNQIINECKEDERPGSA